MPAMGGATASGKCFVCGLVFHLVSSTGVFRRCGFCFGGSFPPCVGSNETTHQNQMSNYNNDDAGVDDLAVGMCCSPTPTSLSELD